MRKVRSGVLCVKAPFDSRCCPAAAADGGALAVTGGEFGDDRSQYAASPLSFPCLVGAAASSAIVLHEDKKYYPDAAEVYPEAETLVQDEDTQPITVPIIAPVKPSTFNTVERTAPETTVSRAVLRRRPSSKLHVLSQPFPQYDTEFMTTLMASPMLVRNVAVIGHLHCGKTTLLDVLVEHTLAEKWDPADQMRYTDARADEQQRGVSIKTTPVSIVLPDTAGKSYLLTVLDTPGHVNFSDEVTASLRAADGVAVVVDAVEGVMLNTERLVKHALQEHLPVVLVIAKLDRLILELKLPPADAYFKLLHTIQEVNALVAAHSPPGRPHPELSPTSGNVIFAGAAQGWSFSLESYARMYFSRWVGGSVDEAAFAKRLWGDIYFDPVSRCWSSPVSVKLQYIFVTCITGNTPI